MTPEQIKFATMAIQFYVMTHSGPDTVRKAGEACTALEALARPAKRPAKSPDGGTVIHDTPRFQAISYNNGAAWALRHKESGKSIAWQYGDEAAWFAREMDTWERNNPDLAYDSILGHIWADYSHLAE
jgi:hypothetical protein